MEVANCHVTFSGQFMHMVKALQGNLQRNKISKVTVIRLTLGIYPFSSST